MHRNSIDLFNDFNTKINQIEVTRNKLDSLYNSNDIDKYDLSQSYSGLYLDLFTEFEAIIEDLFFGLLKGDIMSNSASFNIRININPQNLIDEVLLNGKKYLDWLPYEENTIPRAKRYFKNGEPFTLIDSTDSVNLKKYHIIRNAIAHKSKSSKDKFKEAISGLSLLPDEKNPARFLLSIPNRRLGINQFEIIKRNIIIIANKLCK